MPYLDYNQSNGYLLPPYLEELIPADHVASGENRVGQELPRKVKQALEKREAIVAANKGIQEIKENDRTGKKEPKLNSLEIEEVGDRKSARLGDNVQKVDISGYYLMTGLIDAHVH